MTTTKSKQFDVISGGTMLEGDDKYVVYRYRGLIERGIGRRYVWHEGYSETSSDNGIYYPWMTKSECRESAKKYNRKAKFMREEE